MTAAAAVYCLKQHTKEADYVEVIDNGARDDSDDLRLWPSYWNQGISCRVLKSVLVAESGFFRAMFSNAWKVRRFRQAQSTLTSRQENELLQVHLYEDNKYAMMSVFQALTRLPVRPLWYTIDGELWRLLSIPGTYNDKLTTILGWCREMYFLADKYDMPAVRRLCAEHLFHRIFEIAWDYMKTHWQFDEGPAAFLTHFFNIVFDKLGHFPQDLFDIYCSAVLHYQQLEYDVGVLLDAAEKCPGLLRRVTEAMIGEKTTMHHYAHSVTQHAQRYSYEAKVLREVWRKVRDDNAQT
jgi:hypothetical protein